MIPACGRKEATWLAVLYCFLCCLPANIFGQEVGEEKVVAAMSLQLLNFTEWPDKKKGETIAIGVVSNTLLAEELRALIESKQYQGRFKLRSIQPDAPNEAYQDLDALFFGSSDYQRVARAIKSLDNQPVVLMAAFDEFLEIGGVVNFTIKNRKFGFEINLNNAKARNLKFRAQLLRIASRIVEE